MLKHNLNWNFKSCTVKKFHVSPVAGKAVVSKGRVTGAFGISIAQKLRCQPDSRELGFLPIMGAVSRGVINIYGISSPIGWNSKYALVMRIKISLPKRNQEKQWTLEFSLEVYFPQGVFFCLLPCLLPVNVSIHRKGLVTEKKNVTILSHVSMGTFRRGDQIRKLTCCFNLPKRFVSWIMDSWIHWA